MKSLQHYNKKLLIENKVMLSWQKQLETLN